MFRKDVDIWRTRLLADGKLLQVTNNTE